MTVKIWIYVISKELSAAQMLQLTSNCNAFVSSWTAHEVKLTASFEIYKNRLLLMKVDESAYNASGCSIDKLQRFIKLQETELNIELLNRLLVALEISNGLTIVHSSKIKDLLAANTINENTMVYDTAISSSEELKEWKKPLNSTWLCKYLSNSSTK